MLHYIMQVLSCVFGGASDETLDGNHVERERDGACMCVHVWVCERRRRERERAGRGDVRGG